LFALSLILTNLIKLNILAEVIPPIEGVIPPIEGVIPPIEGVIPPIEGVYFFCQVILSKTNKKV